MGNGAEEAGRKARLPSPTETAWAAGLFEGEGCLAVYPTKRGRTQVQMQLSMTDRDVVEKFAAIVGCGRIYAEQPKPPSVKPAFRWMLSRRDHILLLIGLLSPWFGERRRAKAMLILALPATKPPTHERTHCPHGHPYDTDNTYVWGGGRQCLACRRVRHQKKATNLKTG